MFDRDLTKVMHCFVASENLVLDRGLSNTHGKFLGNTLINFKYEGCQESSWTPMIKASNEPNFDIHYYASLK